MPALPTPVRIVVALSLVWMVAGVEAHAQQRTASELWDLVRDGGTVALIRHARAPGFGDPPGFRVDDCATQRNLSEEGREQARRIGEMFREHNVVVDKVVSSQWCRCLETASLLGLAPVEPFPALNSFFERPERRDPQLAALVPWLSAARPRGTLVAVTHQVVISALTGTGTRSGEIVIVRPGSDKTGAGGFDVLGRIPPP